MPKRISEKQLAANRANAACSTGPRTPEGKGRSSRNARKHSFAGSDFAIVKIEEREAVDRLLADLLDLYRPVNSQEMFAVERIALAQHNLLRIARFEAGLFTAALNRALFNPEEEAPFVPLHQDLQAPSDKAAAEKAPPEDLRVQNRYYCLAHGFHQMNREEPRTWALFLRYQAQAERQYRRAIEEFERLKALRPNFPNEPISGPELPDNIPAPASANEPICGNPPYSTRQVHLGPNTI